MFSPIEKPRFIRNLKSYFIEDIDERIDYIANDGDEIEFDRANVISTKGKDGYNYLLLDIDDNAEVWPSTAPGHYHIAFKRRLGDGEFNTLVETLYKAGIIAEGNYGQFLQGGKMYLRTPWVPKGGTKDLVKQGRIGPTYDSPEEAAKELHKAARYLGIAVAGLDDEVARKVREMAYEEPPF